MEVTEKRRAVPAEITSPRAKLVYFTILTTGGITVEELQETLSLKKITLFAILASLADQKLIERRNNQWVITG